MRGYFLVNFLKLLKFLEINYPINLLQYYQNNKRDLFDFVTIHKYNIAMEDRNVLPQIFQYYRISPYLFDNSSMVLI